MRHSDIEASSLAIPTVVAHSKEDENEEVEEATNAERDATSRASVETAQKHKSPEEEDDSGQRARNTNRRTKQASQTVGLDTRACQLCCWE